jgi:Tfp pilus assembly protein PilF
MPHRLRMVALVMALATSSSTRGQSPRDNWKQCTSSNPEQSIAGCSTLIQSGQESDANLSKAFDSRGLAYMHKRDYDRALQDYDQAIHLDPRSATAIYNRGLTYRLKGDYGHAISDYDQALELTPTDADSFYGRGLSYAQQGNYDRAVQDYSQALRINPGMAHVFHLRSIAYVHKGAYLQALVDYGRWRGILGLTTLCLVLVALAFGVSEVRKGDRHNAGSLRRALAWIFAAEALHYLEIGLKSMPDAVHQHSGFALLAAAPFPLLVAYISGGAWLTIWQRRPSARGFAIAASAIQILIFVWQFVPPVRFAGDFHVIALWVGAVGLLAFLSRKQEWSPWSPSRPEQSHLTTLFHDEPSSPTITKPATRINE